MRHTTVHSYDSLYLTMKFVMKGAIGKERVNRDMAILVGKTTIHLQDVRMLEAERGIGSEFRVHDQVISVR